jgi:hypothetical protein
VTVSIRSTLSLLPSGAMGQELSWDQVSRHLRDHYDTEAEKNREARHRLRDQLYADGGIEAMSALIDLVFVDPTVRELRKRWVKVSRFNNAMKRIVNELSSVYAEPAIREVDDEGENEKYRAVQEQCRQDEVFVRLNRMLNLHRWLLAGFRVRELASGEREPVIDLASPSIARAVIHPNDSTQVIGWLIRVAHRNYHSNSETDRVPSWVLWTDHEKAKLNDSLFIIGEPEPHGFKRNPWVPVTRGPMVPGFYPGDEGEDLVAAQMSIWFANICMLKETKSATNQTVLSGDLGAMSRNQAMDTETPIEAPDGVGVSTVDMSMDVSMFGRTADHILEHAANNYGMSLSLIKHQSATSAASRELMRVPLRELRREQQVPLRAFEKRFAEVQSMVLARDLPELAFKTAGWSIDFGESQTPLSSQEASLQFEKDRQLGLTNTVDFILEKNPDLTEEAAIEWLERNVKLEVLRNRLMRPLQAINGSMGQSLDEARTPGQNGAAAVAENQTIQEMAS